MNQAFYTKTQEDFRKGDRVRVKDGGLGTVFLSTPHTSLVLMDSSGQLVHWATWRCSLVHRAPIDKNIVVEEWERRPTRWELECLNVPYALVRPDTLPPLTLAEARWYALSHKNIPGTIIIQQGNGYNVALPLVNPDAFREDLQRRKGSPLAPLAAYHQAAHKNGEYYVVYVDEQENYLVDVFVAESQSAALAAAEDKLSAVGLLGGTVRVRGGGL